MGDNRGQTIAWLIGRIDGIENLLRKIAPKYRLMGSDILTLPDEAVKAAQRTVAEPSRPRDWASLPPIQRTAGEMPLVAAPGQFVDALPGTTGLPQIVQPLGHEVSAMATPGLVVARVRPVEHAAPGRLPAPVQRRSARQPHAAAESAPGLPDAEPGQTDAHPASSASLAAPAASSAARPVRSMPTVSRLSIQLPDRPLTSASVAARPAAVQRTTQAVASVPSSSPLPAPSGGMRRSPSAAPARPIQREAIEIHPAPVEPAGPVHAAANPPRRGLGEPVTAAPASARPVTGLAAPVVHRSMASGRSPGAPSPSRATVQRLAGQAGPIADHHRHVDLQSSGPAVASAPALPHLSVVGAARVVVAEAKAAPSRDVVQRATAGPVVRPLVGAAPIRPSVAIQRSTSEDRDADDEPGNGELPTPWWAHASDPVGSGPAGAGTGLDAAPAIQRSAVPSAFPSVMVSPAARPGSHADRVPAQPAARSAPVQRSAAAPSRIAMPVRGAADHTHAPGALALPPTDGTEAAPARTPGGSLVVQTSAAPGSAGPAGAQVAAPAGLGSVPVQRADDARPTPVAQPATPDQPDHRSEQELDRLAQQLFGRIRGRIRSELIHDREAKGLTFDSI